jgi:1,4-alpha-glucan branching enzyme
MPQGELAIVLHTHMPYVEGGMPWPVGGIADHPVQLSRYLRNPEGFGTWPFGEEWLWEAIATSYLPLLDVLDAGDGPAPLTLSLTPVLCDQLEHPGAMARCEKFLRGIRPESHRRDAAQLRAAGESDLAVELERSAAEYAAAADRLAALEGGAGQGLLGALAAHATWTSSASHAVLPLIATDGGLALQLRTGIASHRRRAGHWKGGLWLPECAHAGWLAPALARAGVRATCVELTPRLGLGDARHLRPLQPDEGPVLWPIDRLTIDRVWGVGGYPSHPAYRDYHRYTTHRHRVWGIDGAPYDHTAALAQARTDAARFLGAVRERVSGGGVCVCALDTELLGHWWYEGVAWLGEVLAQADYQGVSLTTLDDALERHPAATMPAEAVSPHATSWGEGGDLRTWSGPRAAPFARRARSAELALARRCGPVGERALRELLALQASDWAFLHHRDLSGAYPEERAAGHAAALSSALADDPAAAGQLRGLAPWLEGWSG